MKRINWLYLIIFAVIIGIIYFSLSFNKTDKQDLVYQEEDISMFKHRDFSI